MAKGNSEAGGGKDWMDEFFEKHGITEDDDRSFLKSRALADEFVEEARNHRAKPPAPKKKGLFARKED